MGREIGKRQSQKQTIWNDIYTVDLHWEEDKCTDNLVQSCYLMTGNLVTEMEVNLEQV
jgi:hypothetical protein